MCCDYLFVMPGCHLLANPVRLRKLSIAAVVDEKASVPIDGSGEQLFSDNVARNGGNMNTEDDLEGLDHNKMIRICDKLVDVFMVDKPTPTDWRRLLAFSKEWNNIRPHFYRRCQDLAESNDDPGMKHKLLRLGRKLKEVVI